MVVERSLLVMSELCHGTRTVAELAKAINMSKASAYRLLQSLEEDGWVASFGAPKSYAPTFRLAELGIAFLLSRRDRTIILPLLSELAQAVAKRVSLAFYERGDAVTTDAVSPFGERLSWRLMGVRIRAGYMATGKALLAFQPTEEIERVLAQDLERRTPQTLADPRALRAELERIRELGYAITNQEWQPGLVGMAVPIHGEGGAVSTAIGITLGSSLPDADVLSGMVERAKEVASRASLLLGGVRQESPSLA